LDPSRSGEFVLAVNRTKTAHRESISKDYQYHYSIRWKADRLLGDRKQQGVTAQNLGILDLTRAEASRDPAERERLLRRALASVKRGLEIRLAMRDQVNAADSYS